jgi:RNA polymerase sigma factor (sigma-70 family)
MPATEIAAVVAPAATAPPPPALARFEEWGRLMVAAHDGNGGAYRRLLSELSVWLRRYYARRLPASMAEDAAQEALSAIHNKRHTYEPGRPFGPWLSAIARYKWIDHLRALGRDRSAPLDDDLPTGDHESAVTSAVVLNDLLARLKPAQALVIRLVKLQGYSVEEASAFTGQSLSLVKVNIHRGLGRLAAIVQADGAPA